MIVLPDTGYVLVARPVRDGPAPDGVLPADMTQRPAAKR